MIAKTVERIAWNPLLQQHPTVVKAEQATWIEIKLQEFSESINACVQEKKEENKRFWTYLVHFEALKHQFLRYIKSKHVDFPRSLLQQFISKKLKRLLQQKQVRR